MQSKLLASVADRVQGGPPPCNSDMKEIEEDPNIILIVPYSHYYWVGGST